MSSALASSTALSTCGRSPPIEDLTHTHKSPHAWEPLETFGSGSKRASQLNVFCSLSFIFEISEVSAEPRARRIESDHADKGAGERAVLAGAGFVREDRGVEHGSDVTPCAVKRAGELKLGLVDRDGEPHSLIRAERDRRGKRGREAALGIALRAQYCQRAAERLVPGDRRDSGIFGGCNRRRGRRPAERSWVRIRAPFRRGRRSAPAGAPPALARTRNRSTRAQ